MGLPVNVEEILRGRVVERDRIEFKRGWNPKKVLHTLCAFANDFHNVGGGYLFIGVEESNGRPVLPPVGLNPDDLDGLQKDILNLGYRIRPAYVPVIEPYEIDGKHLLVLWAPGGQTRPYKAPEDLGKECKAFNYYIRIGSESVVARDNLERELLQLAATVPFDDRVQHRASLSDLSSALVRDHLQIVGSDLFAQADGMDTLRLCEAMKIVDGPPEHPMPRNVGLMFFCRDPERFFPGMRIEVALHPNGLAGKDFVEKIFNGPLATALRAALDFLKNQVLAQHVRKHPDRAEAERFYNYPYAAIEEALVNAVYHRSYEGRDPVEVQVLPTEIRITSFPGPDRSVRMDDLRAGQAVTRRYRNRRIGDFLKELDLTEGRGTGIPTILRAMRDNGSPEPGFLTDDERSYLTVVLPVHPEAAAEEPPQATPGVTPEVAVAPPLHDVEVKILRWCIEARSILDIGVHVQIGDRKHLRSRYVNPLVRKGFLELTEPDAPTSPTQRYRTTERGIEAAGDGGQG